MSLQWLRRFLFREPKSEPPPTAEIRRFFNAAAADEEHFPSTIDARIYHVQIILEHLGEMGGKRILDVGCGKGRFARIVKERHPDSVVVAVDLAEEMLRRVPTSVHRVTASMNELPLASNSFDGAYATESLEHAISIETAVAEICRVVRPGGKIVIIDKNIEQWGKLATPDWEKWFGRKELETLLERHCTHVSSRFISYWEDVSPDGLFLAWLAEK